jgi:hypothetical protein
MRLLGTETDPGYQPADRTNEPLLMVKHDQLTGQFGSEHWQPCNQAITGAYHYFDSVIHSQ